MLTILYSAPKRFAAGPVRVMLTKHVPLYSWTGGEDDDGTDMCAVDFGGRPILLIGRSQSDSIFVEVARQDGSDEPLPPHAMQIRVKRPATDSDALAERIVAVLASTMAYVDKDGVRLRFDGTDTWLTLHQVVRLAELVIGGERIADVVAGLGASAPASPAPAPAAASSSARPPAPGLGGISELARLPMDDRPPFERGQILGVDVLALAYSEQSFAQALGGGNMPGLSAIYDFSGLPAFHDELPRTDRLPTLALLHDAPLAIDVAELQSGLAVIDPDGGWTVDRGDDGVVRAAGRGGVVSLAPSPHALPAFMVEIALHRSLGATAGEPMRALRRHRLHTAITADIDPSQASWLDTRETAKAMVMIMAIAHRPVDGRGHLVGMFNAATASCFTADMIPDLVGALAQNEVSIKTFVWHAFASLETDRICISSAGLLPFIGRELEVWNAPGDLDFVGDRLNKIERYLLLEGPVFHDGDTIGDKADDPWARLWHGTSEDGSRPTPVPVLKAEICGPGGRWRPRHDPPRADPPLGSGGIGLRRAAEPAPAAAGFGRRTFGRRGA